MVETLQKTVENEDRIACAAAFFVTVDRYDSLSLLRETNSAIDQFVQAHHHQDVYKSV